MRARVITMDSREQAADLAQELAATHGFEIRRAQLPRGDYWIGQDTLVERKTTRDFALSVIDGRLFDQAYRLVTFEEHPILVIEGMNFATDVHLSGNAVRGALITLAQTFRLPVLRTRDQIDTAWTFARLFEQRCRVGTGHGPLRAGLARRLRLRKERVLQALPGIGPETARRLLGHFGSVAAVMAAQAADLQQVPGIGPKRAASLLETVHEEPPPWGAGMGPGQAAEQDPPFP